MILLDMNKVPYAEHPGYQKTIFIDKKQYYWLGTKNEVVILFLDALNIKRSRQSTNI
jgi:hypothetical protein